MAKCFAITNPKSMNLTRKCLWQGSTSSVFQAMSVQEQWTSQQINSSLIEPYPPWLHVYYAVTLKNLPWDTNDQI